MTQENQASSQLGGFIGSTGPMPTGFQQVGMAHTGPVDSAQVSRIRMGASGGAPLVANPSRILAAGRYQIELHSFSAEIDSAFDQAYEALVRDLPLPWDAFSRIVNGLLGMNPSPSEMDKFFQTAEPIAYIFIQEKRLEEACHYWQTILNLVTNAEISIQAKFHKGSGYFFWACSWFLRGDADTGLLIMHEAFIEDKRRLNCTSQTWPTSSASMVISLDKDQSQVHPASWWVNEQVIAINNALLESGSSLSADDIRRRLFLVSEPEAISLFVYSHSSLLRIESISPDHRDNRFVARLALGHLFQITVMLENVLKARSGTTGLFMAQIQELSNQIGGQLKTQIPLMNNGTQYASNISAQIRADANLLLGQLLNGTADYQDTGMTKVSICDKPLCIVYALRNVGAHCIDAPTIVAEELHALRVQTLAALARCVETYYP